MRRTRRKRSWRPTTFRISATSGRPTRRRPKWPKGEWDCLVRSGGGRFLWLRMEFRGNGRVTPRLDSIELEFPRISLRRYLPAVFGKEAVSADFTDRFLSLFDTTFRSIETNLDREARFFDPLSAPAERDPKTGADFLSWLGFMDRPHSRSPLARGQAEKVPQERGPSLRPARHARRFVARAVAVSRSGPGRVLPGRSAA